MEIEIIAKKENPFFKRKELKVEIKHLKEATPSKEKLIKELAKKFSVQENQISVDYVFTKKGVSSSIAKVKIEEEKSEAQTSEAK